MMDRDHFEDLKYAYALGALPDGELREFEEYLAANPNLQPEVDELAQLSSLLAVSPADREPPRDLRKSLMAEAESRTSAGRAARTHRRAYRERFRGLRGLLAWRNLALGAAVLLLVALAGWNVGLRGEVHNLRGDNSQLQARVERLGNTEGGRILAMKGQGDMKQVRAEVVSLKDGRTVLVADGMPHIPQGKTFQIWVINGKKAQPSGLFRPNEASPVAAAVKNPLQGASAVAVTVEPAGGSPQPTTTPNLLAET